MALSQAQAVTILTRLGFRANTSGRYRQALYDFQRGWNLGPALSVDGIKGPMTDKALLLSAARRANGLGTMSAHFSFSEFVCKCGGRYADCRRVWMARAVVQALETSRTRLGRPISVTSGCRCPNYNRAVGGASNSQHMYGLAVDWTGPDKDTTRSWRLWRGIGFGAHSDRSLHTDLRSSTSAASPAMWVYPGW